MEYKIYTVSRTSWFALLACMVTLLPATGFAQEVPYYSSNSTQIYSNRPTTTANRPSRPQEPLQPFRIDVAQDQPETSGLKRATQETPQTSDQNPVRFAALSKTFGESPDPVVPTGRIQEIFGESQQPGSSAAGTTTSNTNSSPNPFQKVAPQETTQSSASPFQEVAPAEKPVTQDANPFSQLADDPTPITPPMDTRPAQDGAPTLPPGGEFTPTPGSIDPNPPVPGEATKPQKNEPPAVTEQTQPDEVQQPDIDKPEVTQQEEPAESVFDSKEIEDELESNPVPAPSSSRVYLPAREPTDYVQAPEQPLIMVPPGYNPAMATQNPYAGLPGPYGYAAPPSQPPYSGYGPGQYQQYPYAAAAPAYGQCGPGCMPTSQCSTCSSCGPCNSCNSCSTGSIASCGSNCGPQRPTLPGSDIGDRIVETADVDACDDEAYTEVVSRSDSVCSNFASCYIGIFGGATDLNDFVTRGDIGTGTYFEDSGYLFGFTVGQIQGRNLRTELELSYRNINVNGMRLEGAVPSQFVGVHGDFGAFAGMFNGYWEFVDFRAQKIKPYIGGGIGFALARPNLLQTNGLEAVIDDNESSFAWQWMAGLNYKASPTLDAFVEYRYFAADSFRLDTQIPEVAGLGDGSGSFDYRSGAVLFGMRARF